MEMTDNELVTLGALLGMIAATIFFGLILGLACALASKPVRPLMPSDYLWERKTLKGVPRGDGIA